jgi:DNA-binding NarL/FixJ family response regulator
MARTCCLAGVRQSDVARLSAVVLKSGALAPTWMARINVAKLRTLQPGIVVCDIDEGNADALETLRQIRFVLPDCIITIYSGRLERSWAVACHLAGANGVFFRESTQAELVRGIRGALKSGCFTDPRFAAA